MNDETTDKFTFNQLKNREVDLNSIEGLLI